MSDHEHAGAGGHDHEDMLWRPEATERVLSLREQFLPELGTEAVDLDAVAGRALAEDLIAPDDVPAYDHATMDGFAFRADDGYPLDVRDGETFPEDDPAELGEGEAVRIATGAPLPDRADVVLKREESRVEDGRLHGPDLSPGTYVYRRGSNVEAGETLFEAGERLSPKDAILLGDLGLERVEVRERLSAGLLATGTEIHEGRSRDLDSPMLAGLIESWGHEATHEGSVPDEYDRVEGAIADVADEHDVVVTTGGTSVGHKDHVVRALAALGEVRFHRVRLRPGKPIAFARLPDHDAVAIAVPGKPVGAHVVTTLVARPFFTGDRRVPTVDATLASDVSLGPEGFEYAVPVTLDGEEATPLGHVDSPLAVYEGTFDPSVLSSSTRATRADGLVVTTEAVSAGDRAEVVPFPAIEN